MPEECWVSQICDTCIIYIWRGSLSLSPSLSHWRCGASQVIQFKFSPDCACYDYLLHFTHHNQTVRYEVCSNAMIWPIKQIQKSNLLDILNYYIYVHVLKSHCLIMINKVLKIIIPCTVRINLGSIRQDECNTLIPCWIIFGLSCDQRLPAILWINNLTPEYFRWNSPYNNMKFHWNWI